jgi:hypothetical protein
MIEFNFVNTDLDDCIEFPDLCCSVDDYFSVVSGDITLVDPDEMVSFHKVLNIHVTYPCDMDETFSFTSDTGFTRLKLLEAISNAYLYTFGMMIAAGKIGPLFLEGAEISPEGNVELHIGT